MATARQMEANQSNAARSTGPRTEAGKARSRANAVRHGLSGKGFVLPAEEAELVAERIVSWSEGFVPRDEQESWLVEQVALESVRVERCQERERVVLREESERAELFWEADR